MTEPEQHAPDVLEFFEKTIPDQIHLTALDPEKHRRAMGQDFGRNAEAAAAWAMERNAEGLNVYFTVNQVRPGVGPTRNKGDITAVRFAHVDVDPPKGAATFTPEERDAALSRLEAAKASIINWSGNGWQGLWRVDGDADVDAIEQVNKGLIQALGGDTGTHDASRLLRVPGLTNWPDARKRSKGRVPRLAEIIAADDGSCHEWQQLLGKFPAAGPVSETTKREQRAALELGEVELLSADGLNLPHDAVLRRLIDAPKGVDRSADTMAMACEGLREGLTDEQVIGVLLNPENAISGHCLEQGVPLRAAQRAVSRAWAEQDVRDRARVHARERERRLASGEAEEALTADTKVWTLETMLRYCVFVEEGPQVADTTRLGHIRNLSEFRTATAASFWMREVPGKNGSVRRVKSLVAEAWLEHPDRQSVSTRTFKAGDGTITQAPDGQSALNSWRGFRITDPPNDWEERAKAFVDHVDYLFGDDAGRFLDWVAHIAQAPGELPATAWLHIAQKTGTGRNWLATALGRVFIGYAALAYPLSSSLQNGFNGALAGKVLAVVDEINEGNSHRKHQMKEDLKQLVTETERLVNPKCARQFVEHNACRWLIFSNSSAALPLDDEDRRFNVVRFDGEPRSLEHYGHLYGLLKDKSFIASVMKFLQRRDLSGFKPGDRAPMTAAKEALLERTRSEDEQVLRDLVSRWPVDIITSYELHDLMGADRIKGPALRYALDRTGIVKVGKWMGITHFGRKQIAAYALRNTAQWVTAKTPELKAEVSRLSAAEKEASFYDEDSG